MTENLKDARIVGIRIPNGDVSTGTPYDITVWDKVGNVVLCPNYGTPTEAYMTTGHTPGPWTECGYSVYAEAPQNVDSSRFRGFDEKETREGVEVGYLIAESIPHDATRRLIAAAPDLLDACRVARELCDMNGYDGILRILDAAIGKAQGKK